MPRTETQTRTLYQFDELSDDAKERARDWWRNILAEDTDWSECVLSDAADIAHILGIRLSRRRLDRNDSGEPAIYWSINRDGGVGFDASYSYAPGSARRIREHAPQDAELHVIATKLQRIQRRHFYQLTADARANGRDGLSLGVDVERADGAMIDNETDDAIADAIRDFAHWIHSALQREYEWRMSDEQVDEDIRANEYEFTEEGVRA